MAKPSWPDLAVCIGSYDLRNRLTEIGNIKLGCVLDQVRVPGSPLPIPFDTGLREAEIPSLAAVRDDLQSAIDALGQAGNLMIALSGQVGDCAFVFPSPVIQGLELGLEPDRMQRVTREIGAMGGVVNAKVLAGYRTVTAGGDTKAAGSYLDRGASSTSATVYVNLVALSGAANITFALWHSPDGTNWTQATNTLAFTAVGANSFNNTGTLGRYLALSWTFGTPTTPSATFVAAVA